MFLCDILFVLSKILFLVFNLLLESQFLISIFLIIHANFDHFVRLLIRCSIAQFLISSPRSESSLVGSSANDALATTATLDLLVVDAFLIDIGVELVVLLVSISLLIFRCEAFDRLDVVRLVMVVDLALMLIHIVFVTLHLVLILIVMLVILLISFSLVTAVAPHGFLADEELVVLMVAIIYLSIELLLLLTVLPIIVFVRFYLASVLFLFLLQLVITYEYHTFVSLL